jgi:hypothetical protein
VTCPRRGAPQAQGHERRFTDPGYAQHFLAPSDPIDTHFRPSPEPYRATLCVPHLRNNARSAWNELGRVDMLGLAESLGIK